MELVKTMQKHFSLFILEVKFCLYSILNGKEHLEAATCYMCTKQQSLSVSTTVKGGVIFFQL